MTTRREMDDHEFRDTVVASLATLEAREGARAQWEQRIEKALMGNGQPGLIHKVATLEERSSMTKATGAGAASGGVAGIVLLIAGEWLKQKLGIK